MTHSLLKKLFSIHFTLWLLTAVVFAKSCTQIHDEAVASAHHAQSMTQKLSQPHPSKKSTFRNFIKRLRSSSCSEIYPTDDTFSARTNELLEQNSFASLDVAKDATTKLVHSHITQPSAKPQHFMYIVHSNTRTIGFLQYHQRKQITLESCTPFKTNGTTDHHKIKIDDYTIDLNLRKIYQDDKEMTSITFISPKTHPHLVDQSPPTPGLVYAL